MQLIHEAYDLFVCFSIVYVKFNPLLRLDYAKKILAILKDTKIAQR